MNEQAKNFVGKVDERVKRVGEINNICVKVSEAIKIIAEEVLRRSRGKIVDKDT